MSLDWNVVKSQDDDLYYIHCHNETGGLELRTWYGYEDKIHTINEFHSRFDFPVYDHETKNTFTKQNKGNVK